MVFVHVESNQKHILKLTKYKPTNLKIGWVGKTATNFFDIKIDSIVKCCDFF